MIPLKLRKQLNADPFMSGCVLKAMGIPHECHGRIEFHHQFIYQNNQIQEWWAILPVCGYGHANRVFYNPAFEYQSIFRISEKVKLDVLQQRLIIQPDWTTRFNRSYLECLERGWIKRKDG